mgnify:CR=1 FL=1
MTYCTVWRLSISILIKFIIDKHFLIAWLWLVHRSLAFASGMMDAASYRLCWFNVVLSHGRFLKDWCWSRRKIYVIVEVWVCIPNFLRHTFQNALRISDDEFLRLLIWLLLTLLEVLVRLFTEVADELSVSVFKWWCSLGHRHTLVYLLVHHLHLTTTMSTVCFVLRRMLMTSKILNLRRLWGQHIRC